MKNVTVDITTVIYERCRGGGGCYRSEGGGGGRVGLFYVGE